MIETGDNRRRPPRLGSTYRLQLHGVGLAGARALVPYLGRLGVETLYVSPLLAATPGSNHGYDVVDPSHIDPSLGSPADLDALLAELDEHGMRLLVDIVPNHMAASPDNPWWSDVLARGPDSPFARYFDIDWPAQHGRLLVPILGRPLEDVVARGELAVVAEDGQPLLAYFDHRLPLDPTTERLALACTDPRAAAGASQPGRRPGRPAGDDRRVSELIDLLDHQHYRLAFWRLGRYEGNHRRFLDIDGLVGLRVEDPDVYAASHQLVLELVQDHRIAGVRVDHVDGLEDPGAYLRRLRRDLDARAGRRPALMVEKVLARHETLPDSWDVDGTTGYEFADLAGGLLIDGRGAARLRRFGRRAAGRAGGSASPGADRPGRLVTDARRTVIESLFPAELDRVVSLTVAALRQERPGSDIASADVRRALVELTTRLDVYRTYVDAEGPSHADRDRLRHAGGRAAEGLEADGRRALTAVLRLLGSHRPAHSTERPDRRRAVPMELVHRWQQLTGAVAAKGVEDTALYRFDGLLAAAEVGGDLDDPAVSVEAFHAAMVQRLRMHPASLNATSTHDTKRGEDVRARLAVLSEVPRLWQQHANRWRRWHEEWAAGISVHDELVAYQTMVGAWPLGPSGHEGFARRIADYLVKAGREAKVISSWTDPDEAYEHALRVFTDHVLAPSNRQFHADARHLVCEIGPAGAVNGLALSVLKTTAPGTPDIYQGSEMWAHTLVDPDNRRPVDFPRLQHAEESIVHSTGRDGSAGAELLAAWPDGRLKLSATRALLRFRRGHPDLFDRGAYVPLEVTGRLRSHVLAFGRQLATTWIVVVVPRLLVSRAGTGRMPVGGELWHGTSVVLPPDAPARYTCVVTGVPQVARHRRLSMGAVLGTFPIAVLGSVPESP